MTSPFGARGSDGPVLHPDDQEVQGLPDITEDTIRDLATFKGKEPVTTCFLDVDGRRLLLQHQIEQELESVLHPAGHYS